MPWIAKPAGHCQETAGFLFTHPCDRPRAHACQSCGKSICIEHTRLIEARRLCVACARSAAAFDDRDPYFYGHSYYGSHWHDWGSGRSRHDPDDFTDGDASSLKHPGDATFEDDLEAS
jgi:hypothetical protein